MRSLIVAAVIGIGLLVSPALASKSTDTMKACAAAWKTMPAEEKANTTYKAYSTACLKAGGPSAMTTTAAPATTPPPTSQQRMKDCAAKWDAMKKAGTTQGQTYKRFSAKCLKGNA